MARPSKPWYWKQKRIWCVTIDGKRIRLSDDKDEAFRKFHLIKAEKAKPSEDCLLAIMDELLDWTKKHRRQMLTAVEKCGAWRVFEGRSKSAAR